MRLLPLLGLLAGLAMLAWGGYSLYGRFSGGPEVYWGEDKVNSLSKMEGTLAEMKQMLDEDQEKKTQIRAQLDAMPPGDKKAEYEQRLSDLTADTALHEQIIQQSEEKVGEARTYRDEAKGRALRRGILFTFLGLIWSVRAGAAVFAPAKRRPSTAAPDLSPPSPRPGG